MNISIEISKLKELALQREQAHEVKEDSVELAWNNRYDHISCKEDALYLLSSLNLLNTAIKQKKYKKQLGYGGIKKNVTRLLSYLARTNNDYVDNFYISEEENNCAYVKVYDLQFSFHNILMNDTLISYQNSQSGKMTDWEGVRLQRIAQELFELTLQIKFINSLNITLNT